MLGPSLREGSETKPSSRSTAPSGPNRRGTGDPRLPDPSERRSDHAYLVPTTRIFFPETDPTEQFPDRAANVEGYVVAPGSIVTLAVAVSDPQGIDLLDSIWAAVKHRGWGIRQLTILNDRGRVVSLMTLHANIPEETVRLLQSLLLVPVRLRNGLAEIHFLATPEDFAALGKRIKDDGLTSGHAPVTPARPVRDAGALIPQDWAFLGLLSIVGAFDGPEGLRPGLLAEALGIDAGVFAERVRAVERGLNGLVTGLFAPVEARTGGTAQ